MFILKSVAEASDWSMVRHFLRRFPPRLVSLRSWVFCSQKLTHALHSLVRVSRRGDFDHFVCDRGGRLRRVSHVPTNNTKNPKQAGHMARAIKTQSAHLPAPTFACNMNSRKLGMCQSALGRVLPTSTRPGPHTGQKRLPFKQFQVLLTPSSGSFSSFPHGTCSLSVSRPYLAFDGIYHPLGDAIPSISTRRKRTVTSDIFGQWTGLSPSLASHSRELVPNC